MKKIAFTINRIQNVKNLHQPLGVSTKCLRMGIELMLAPTRDIYPGILWKYFCNKSLQLIMV